MFSWAALPGRARCFCDRQGAKVGYTCAFHRKSLSGFASSFKGAGGHRAMANGRDIRRCQTPGNYQELSILKLSGKLGQQLPTASWQPSHCQGGEGTGLSGWQKQGNCPLPPPRDCPQTGIKHREACADFSVDRVLCPRGLLARQLLSGLTCLLQVINALWNGFGTCLSTKYLTKSVLLRLSKVLSSQP